MQNNQLSLQDYLRRDFKDQYEAEDYQDREEIDLFEKLNDNDDYFNESYAELSEENKILENESLKLSQPYTNSNSSSFLSTTINDVDYHNEDDNSQYEDDEIHYLNFIRKSEIAVSQQNSVLSQSYRDDDCQLEENIKTYTVVCIDDSKAVVNAIKMYLDDNIFSIVGINDPLKALMQVIRLKPDLILLDISMPTLDGYELCSLLRKHSAMKETPIIMVTGKKGIINRVKAKMVKASDYITKPFGKKDLLKVIFKYIV